MPKYVLKVGTKYFCNDEEDGYTWLGNANDEKLVCWPTFEDALLAGQKIFQDKYCHKFQVVPYLSK